MFNKPSVFGRNEPITRRDSQPVLGYSSQNSRATPDKNTVVEKEAAEKPAATQTATATNTPAPAAATAATPKESSSTTDNVIGARLIVGPDVKLKGAEILDCDTLVVEGRVEATMDSRVIRIAENGSFAGTVSIDIAEIHGTFEGELTARSQLIIHSTGRVSGTIRFGKLVVDEGGELCGEINVISGKAATPSKPAMEPYVALNAAAG